MASDLRRIVWGGYARVGLDRVQFRIVRLLTYSLPMRTDGDAPWGGFYSCVVQHAEIIEALSDAVETFGQDVDEEAADELTGGKRHPLVSSAAVGAVILVPEGDAVFVERDQPRNRGVAPESYDIG
jgi:hypothetical protein